MLGVRHDSWNLDGIREGMSESRWYWIGCPVLIANHQRRWSLTSHQLNCQENPRLACPHSLVRPKDICPTGTVPTKMSVVNCSAQNSRGDEPDFYVTVGQSEPQDQGYIYRRRGVVCCYGIRARCVQSRGGSKRVSVQPKLDTSRFIKYQDTLVSISTRLSPRRPDTPQIGKYTIYHTNTIVRFECYYHRRCTVAHGVLTNIRRWRTGG